jgi:hypothetical protein
MKYTVSIIGLGSIGMLYDIDSFDNSTYLSHVKSFADHDGFIIRYLIDKDIDKLSLAKSRYGNNITYLTSVDDIRTMTDIVVFASVPVVNKQLFDQLRHHSEVKLFLLEKPFWDDNMIPEDYSGISSKCYINYYRKSLPLIRNIYEKIQSGKLGNPLGVHVWYSKGLRNNGSHMIDLVNYLFNNNYIYESISTFHQINDYSAQDLSVSFSIKYKFQGHEFPVLFQVADEKAFSLIEMDLVFEKRRYRLTESGGKIEVFTVKKDSVFAGYFNLNFDETLDSNINCYGMYTCNQIYDIVSKNIGSPSTLLNEYNTYRIIDGVKKVIRNE